MVSTSARYPCIVKTCNCLTVSISKAILSRSGSRDSLMISNVLESRYPSSTWRDDFRIKRVSRMFMLKLIKYRTNLIISICVKYFFQKRLYWLLLLLLLLGLRMSPSVEGNIKTFLQKLDKYFEISFAGWRHTTVCVSFQSRILGTCIYQNVYLLCILWQHASSWTGIRGSEAEGWVIRILWN